jgi:DNA mismatch repair protein MutS
MHHLTSLEEIKKLDKLNIYHLDIKYDNVLEKLIINRKLQEGSGGSLYGIEILKMLNLDPTFISRALEIRNNILKIDNFLSVKSSHYNSDLYMDQCFLCGRKEQLHTHHIIPQKLADEQGKIGVMDKDVLQNLVVLCEECHVRIHNSKINIKSEQIPGGFVLNIID